MFQINLLCLLILKRYYLLYINNDLSYINDALIIHYGSGNIVGNLLVSGTINGSDANITGNTTLSGNVTANANVIITGSANVTGNIAANGYISASGYVSGASLSTSGNLTVSGSGTPELGTVTNITLVTDTTIQTNEILQTWPEGYIYGTLSEYYQKRHSAEDAMMWKAKFDSAWQTVEYQNSLGKWSGGNTRLTSIFQPRQVRTYAVK